MSDYTSDEERIGNALYSICNILEEIRDELEELNKKFSPQKSP